MSSLKLKDVKIKMPKDFNGSPSDLDIIEWLEYRFGARCDIRISNPLYDTELSDCEVSIGKAEIDGKAFIF